ncbi:unnamed protein product [Periconia digitata]|uniref:Uncharacterized protein n=1 Tax=Periconia digitata TaxID=1303443 RepID=A0A9W4XRR4_9PLEO|nr:unnamed protein product [Periconia digitata]
MLHPPSTVTSVMRLHVPSPCGLSPCSDRTFACPNANLMPAERGEKGCSLFDSRVCMRLCVHSFPCPCPCPPPLPVHSGFLRPLFGFVRSVFFFSFWKLTASSALTRPNPPSVLLALCFACESNTNPTQPCACL